MRVLVTGGAGFIGSFTVDRLIRLGHKVRILDNLDPQVHPGGAPRYVNREAEFIKADIRDYNIVKRSIKDVEIIFHFAACVGVGQSQYLIKKYTDVSIGGTANLLDIVVNTKNKVKKIIVAGSMSSYGEGLYRCSACGDVRPGMRSEESLKKNIWEPVCPRCAKKKLRPFPIYEEAAQQCNSIYAITKKVQEEMVLLAGRTYKIPAVSLRFFNVYGPRQALSNPYTGVCAIFLSRIKNNRPPVVYEDGLQTRDFISVHDVVEANLLAMNKKEADYQVFNVGTGRPVCIREIAEMLIKLCKKPTKPKITNQYRKGDIRHCFADITKLKNLLGFTPKVKFEDGMKELIEWARLEKAKDGFEKAKVELKKKGLL